MEESKKFVNTTNGIQYTERVTIFIRAPGISSPITETAAAYFNNSKHSPVRTVGKMQHSRSAVQWIEVQFWIGFISPQCIVCCHETGWPLLFHGRYETFCIIKRAAVAKIIFKSRNYYRQNRNVINIYWGRSRVENYQIKSVDAFCFIIMKALISLHCDVRFKLFSVSKRHYFIKFPKDLCIAKNFER